MLTEGSLAARAAGELAHATKSHHHQGVDRLGEGLVVSGVSTLDELPEAIELPGQALRARRAVAPRGRRGEPGGRRAGARPRAAAARSRAGVAPERRASRARRTRPYTPAAVRRSKRDQSNRLGGGRGGRRRAAGAQARQAPRRSSRRRSRSPRRSACAWRCAARARATWPPARCRCGPTWPRTSRRTTTPTRRSDACTSTTRSSPTACSASASCRPCACSARSRGVGPTAADWRALDRVLVWAHWSWFMVPHGSLAYILVRHRERFPRAAVMTYAVFDIGASVYWLLPTAPPWYAAAAAGRRATRAQRRAEPVRRMMVEYGEFFWRDGWGPLYSVFGGNPLAAMPSLHFATSLMAALLLAEVGPVAGALGLALHGDARLRAGVPGRALRRRSARGRGADRGGAPAGARARGRSSRRVGRARRRRWRRWRTRRV